MCDEETQKEVEEYLRRHPEMTRRDFTKLAAKDVRKNRRLDMWAISTPLVIVVSNFTTIHQS